jgi:hypothetical protein
MVMIRNRNRNLSKVGTGTVINSYGSATLPLSINQPTRDSDRSIRLNMSPERSATLPIGDLAKTSPPTEKLEAGAGPVGEDRSSLQEERDKDARKATKLPTAI